jgi:CRISPR/Cas system CMR subunit Cmr4 (Cas7 group RAMP superfamily)
MKNLLAFIICLFGLFPHLNAQEENASQHPKAVIANKARNEALNAQQKLGLTTEQFAKWYQAAFKRMDANEPLFEKIKNSQDKEQNKKTRQEIRENRKKFDEEVNAFLNDDQKSKWAAWKEERKNQIKQNRSDKKNKKQSASEESLEMIEFEN